MQPPSPFDLGSNADAPGGWAGIVGGRGGDTVIKSTLSPAASLVINVATLRALELVWAAGEAGEMPVDAVVFSPERVIFAEAADVREAEHDPMAHAEIRALRAADATLGDSHLDGYTPVITLEPCTMCASAIVLARVARLVLGAWKPRTGACGSMRDVVRDARANHQVEMHTGLRAQGSQELLTAFFVDRR